MKKINYCQAEINLTKTSIKILPRRFSHDFEHSIPAYLINLLIRTPENFYDIAGYFNAKCSIVELNKKINELKQIDDVTEMARKFDLFLDNNDNVYCKCITRWNIKTTIVQNYVNLYEDDSDDNVLLQTDIDQFIADLENIG